MEAGPEEAGYLYVDGHVRVYNGELATLPQRFVSLIASRMFSRWCQENFVNIR